MNEHAVVKPGDPCPYCGGQIVVDVDRSYLRVPVEKDGYDYDKGKALGIEESPPYCRDCEREVDVDWAAMG